MYIFPFLKYLLYMDDYRRVIGRSTLVSSTKAPHIIKYNSIASRVHLSYKLQANNSFEIHAEVHGFPQ